MEACDFKCSGCDSTGLCTTCKGDRLNMPICNCSSDYYDDGASTNC